MNLETVVSGPDAKKSNANQKSQNRVVAFVVTITAISAGLFHLYTGAFGSFSTMTQRSIHLIFMCALAFLCYPLLSGRARKYSWLADVPAVVLAAIPSLYILLTWQSRMYQAGLATQLETVLGVILLIAVLEATRRTVGMGMVLVALGFVLYALLGGSIPGMFGHRGYSLRRLISHLYLTAEGIYGGPIGISSTFIILFTLFGAFLGVLGAGDFFMKLAVTLTGRSKGGPAKAAIISSGLLGTVSGSAIGIIATSGTFTIPIMERVGYQPHVAAAIVALAATGGMLMPPIMGAAAFLMADTLGIHYAQVALAAAIPAILFYYSLFCMVHLEAEKTGIGAVAKEELPHTRSVLGAGWHFLLPLLLLIGLLAVGWSEMKSVFWCTLAFIAVAAVRPSTRPTIAKLANAVKAGVLSSVPVATACATAGIISGVVGLTGLGTKFSGLLIAFSGGNKIALLGLTAISGLVLGMGLPATAVYVVLASLNGPALVSAGFSPIAAHLFLFYFGIISAVTPPVALSAYAASGLAGSNASKTGWTAFLYGLAGYIVPFMFVYSPALAAQGSMGEVLVAAVPAFLGVYLLAVGIEGYWKRQIPILERGILVVAALLLIKPGLATDLVGLGIAVGVWLYERRVVQRQAHRQAINT
ncbi:MAG: TRAP transporter fused permease subunit [Firmicutes bacterium]|nr:TRAP transporter fused permease subunit [Bacillota bacterium]